MINLITYIVSAIFTYVFGKLSKKYGWHENLPIPIQNIIVGSIVFTISVIAVHIFKDNVSVQSIIEQIVVALGGSGTATLAYDTKKIGENRNLNHPHCN